MTADQYLHGILLREAMDAGPNSPLLGVQTTLMPTLRQWAGDKLVGVYPSGSFMKGTAVRSGTDIDLFISLSEHTNETLKEVYNGLCDWLTSAGYAPKRQNVSLNIKVASGAKAPVLAGWGGTAETGRVGIVSPLRGSEKISRLTQDSAALRPGLTATPPLRGSTVPTAPPLPESKLSSHEDAESRDLSSSTYSVDVVPGKRQNALSSDHSLYRRKADTWTKTNVLTHARTVVGAGRPDEIRIVKLWRNQKGLEFPSFYLELSVIRALAARPLPGLLSYHPQPALWQRVMLVFDYLRDDFPAARISDPANANNIISEDLTAEEKARISAAANAARQAAHWEDIVR